MDTLEAIERRQRRLKDRVDDLTAMLEVGDRGDARVLNSACGVHVKFEVVQELLADELREAEKELAAVTHAIDTATQVANGLLSGLNSGREDA